MRNAMLNKVIISAVVAAGVVATGVVRPAAQIADPSASVLRATREALGGEQKLAAVKTLVATGRTNQLRGDNLAAIEFEIAMELPDKYVRKDQVPLQESDPTTVGFNGDVLILIPAPANGAAARLAAVKQDAERLMLGFLALPSPAATLKYVGKAEAPEGKADVVDIKYPDNSVLRFIVSAETHLPVMVSWKAAAQGRRAGDQAAPPAAPAESRLYFADYRDVGGQRLPFHLRRAVGSDTIEETIFDRFRINSKIDPKKFATGL
jgi:hypothetical protein